MCARHEATHTNEHNTVTIMENKSFESRGNTLKLTHLYGIFETYAESVEQVVSIITRFATLRRKGLSHEFIA